MGANTEMSGSREEHSPARWAARAAPVVAIAALAAGAITTGTIGGRNDQIEPARTGGDACELAEAPTVMGQAALTAGDLEAWWWAEHGTMELPIDDAEGEAIGIGRVAAYYIGNQSGVRGDVAFAQAVFQSGWFTSEQSSTGSYNFGGVPDHDAPEGTTPEDPEYYASYETAAQGVQAHLDDLELYAEGDFQADTWDKIGDNWAADHDGHEYWYGDGMIGDLYQEMVDYADELAARREAEAEGEADDAGDAESSETDDGEAESSESDDVTSDDEGDTADDASDGNQSDDGNAEGEEGEDNEEGAGHDDEDCEDDVDPCEQTAAERLGYTEPTLADDFTDFDTSRWNLAGAEPPDDEEDSDEDDDGDGEGDDRTPPVEVDDETLTLTTRVDEPGRLTMTSALGQQYGLWEVRARLPLDAAGYRSSIGLRIEPRFEAMSDESDESGGEDGQDEQDAEADDDAEQDEQEADTDDDAESDDETDDPPLNDDPSALVFMDNAASEPTGRVFTATMPVGDPEPLPAPNEDTPAETDDETDAETDEPAEDEPAEVTLDDNRWHNWAVEWTPDAVRLYLDGELWYETPEGTEIPEGDGYLTLQTESVQLLVPMEDAEDGEDGESTEQNAAADEGTVTGQGSAEEYHFGIDRVRVFELMGQDDECDPPDDDEDPPPTTEQTTTTVDSSETTTTTTVDDAPETTTTTVDDATTTTRPETGQPQPTSAPSDGTRRTPSAASTQTVGTPTLTG